MEQAGERASPAAASPHSASCAAENVPVGVYAGFETAVGYVVVAQRLGPQRCAAVKLPPLYCRQCGACGSRLYACLHCAHISCAEHRAAHATAKEHSLDMETDTLHVYRVPEKRMIVDASLERIKCNVRKAVQQSVHTRQGPLPIPLWNPTDSVLEMLCDSFQRLPIAADRVGLRGMYNLGNTCYMSSVFQVLLQSPLMLDFFLSTSRELGDAEERHPLLSCVSSIFAKAYDGKTTPLALHKELYTIWSNMHNCAGYSEQDAHEFLMSLVSTIRSEEAVLAKEVRSRYLMPSTAFRGKTTSLLCCQRCGNSSPTVEEFIDVALDTTRRVKRSQSAIPFHRQDRAAVLRAYSQYVSDHSIPEELQTESLHSCLERFTQPERIDEIARMTCVTCASVSQFTKTMSFTELPPILCFQLKRFEHAGVSSKIDDVISFPVGGLDMGRYMHGTAGQIAYTYSLFGVICHLGSLSTGHYTCYIRHAHSGDWYFCDDAMVRKSAVAEVLESQAYLLFYSADLATPWSAA